MLDARDIDELRPYVWSAVSRVLGAGHRADVEDVVQRAVIKARCARATFRGQSLARTWLYRIAVNEALMFLRERKVQDKRCVPVVESHTNIPSHRANPEQLVITLEQRRRLVRAILGLTPKLRGEVLRYVLSERGDPLNRVNALKARRHRALLKLREAL